MRIEKAKKLIKELQYYVSVYEKYQPKNMKQTAIKLYAEYQNVSKVANKLNEMGYRKKGRLVAGRRAQVKIKSNDVTAMIDSDIDPEDRLHPIVKKNLNKNRRRKGIVI